MHRKLLLLLAAAAFVTGCDLGGPSRVQSILRVRPPAGTTLQQADAAIYRETQAALLRSEHVLGVAIKQLPEGLQCDPTWLGQSLELQIEAELLLVSLPVGPHSSTQTATILDAVVDGYLQVVVNRERIEKVEVLESLKRRENELQAEIEKRTDELSQLTRHIDRNKRDVQVTKELARLQLKQLYPRLFDAELAKRTAVQRGDQALVRATNEQLDFLREQITKLERGFSQDKETSGDVTARQDTLASLRDAWARLREDIDRLEVELERPSRIQVIQRASK